MTKPKSKKPTLAPPPADAQDAEWMAAPLTAEESQAVTDADCVDPRDDDSETRPLGAIMLLEMVVTELSERQHADFSATRHRAMQLIAEARALL